MRVASFQWRLKGIKLNIFGLCGPRKARIQVVQGGGERWILSLKKKCRTTSLWLSLQFAVGWHCIPLRTSWIKDAEAFGIVQEINRTEPMQNMHGLKERFFTELLANLSEREAGNS